MDKSLSENEDRNDHLSVFSFFFAQTEAQRQQNNIVYTKNLQLILSFYLKF